MARRYINKQYEIEHIQDNAVSFDGFFTPQLSDGINDLNIQLTRVQFLEMLSAIEQGAEVIYPEKYQEITDRFLRMAQTNEGDDYVGDGTYYPAHSAMVEWLPVSPYRKDLEQTPAPLILPAWNVYEFELPDIIENILSFFNTSLETMTGYRVGDAYSLVFNAAMSEITDVVGDFLFNGDGDNLIDVGFNLHVRGSGTLAVELLSVPLGGRVMYQVDSEPNPTDFLQGFFDENDDILDTERDLVSIPPEQDAESIEEITIETDGDHIIYFRLLPTLNDTFIPLSWGAGLRSIRLGAGLTALSAETGEPLIENESNQNLGLIMTTYEELRQAVRDGNLDWMVNAVAARGDGDSKNLSSGIEIGVDGAVAIKSSGSLAGKTVLDTTTLEQNNAGVHNQAKQIQQIFSNVATMKANGFSSANIANLAFAEKNILNFATWTTKIIAYADGSLVVTIDVPKLAEYIYCDGFDNGITQYVINEHTEVEADIIVAVVSNINESTKSEWFTTGATSIRNDYLEYDCYPPPDEEIIITPQNYATTINEYFGGTVVRPAGYRWLLQFSGYLERVSDGTKIDGLYDDGVTMTTQVLRNTANSTSIGFDNYPPFSSEHKYNAIVTAPNSAFEYIGRLTGFNAVSSPSTALTGSITVKKVYLGLEG